MIVTFDKDYLQELYDTGKSGDRKHRYKSEIIKRYRKGIDLLKRAAQIDELFLLPSLCYEELKGDKAGLSSIRINNQYRIEFTVSEQGIEPVVYVCSISELSKQ